MVSRSLTFFWRFFGQTIVEMNETMLFCAYFYIPPEDVNKIVQLCFCEQGKSNQQPVYFFLENEVTKLQA
mgnify:CR=1 FL=1